MEIGLYTFADVSLDPGGVGPAQRLREVVEEIALADEVGLDVFGGGEHHRRDYASSAPAVILAAGAERSSRIRLTSAVSVLSSIELLGTEVAPVVRAEVARRSPAPVDTAS